MHWRRLSSIVVVLVHIWGDQLNLPVSMYSQNIVQYDQLSRERVSLHRQTQWYSLLVLQSSAIVTKRFILEGSKVKQKHEIVPFKTTTE